MQMPIAGHTERMRFTMAIDYISIGSRIKRYRMDKKMSQEELAAKVGTVHKHISNIESGSKGVSLKMVIAIANALDVSADDLLTDNLLHSSSPVSTEVQDIMLDCNNDEKEMLTEILKFMKALFTRYGI